MIEINPYSDVPHFVYDCLEFKSLIPPMIYEFGEPKLHYLFQGFHRMSKASKAIQMLYIWAANLYFSRGLR